MPASENVLFQVTRYCGLTGQGMMKEKANTMVRQRNKDRKKTAVLQWVSLEKPRPSLQLFFFSSVADGAVVGSAPSSPLFRGSPSVGWSVVSIAASVLYRPTDLLEREEITKITHLHHTGLIFFNDNKYSCAGTVYICI